MVKEKNDVFNKKTVESYVVYGSIGSSIELWTVGLCR